MNDDDANIDNENDDDNDDGVEDDDEDVSDYDDDDDDSEDVVDDDDDSVSDDSLVHYLIGKNTNQPPPHFHFSSLEIRREK